MTGRRGFLGLLLGSPLIAHEAAEELANMKTTGIASSATCRPIECDEAPEHPWDSIPGGHKLMSAFEHELSRRETRDNLHFPHHIGERKSWSTAFKQSIADKERRELRSLWNEFHELHRASDPISLAMKVNAFAKKLRIKV